VPTSSTPIWAAGAAGAPTAVPERGRRYRGWVEATADGGPLRLVNQLDVETYLKGMAEVPDDWPAEAIEAQTDAARTYALRAGGELCDDDNCQVYVGVDGESANQNAAVNATAGEVVTYAGALADTLYCADAGGVTATTLEGFGTTDPGQPYLSVVRYPTPNPLPWRAELPLADVAGKLGYFGTLTGVHVGDRGPSGRALTVVLDGSAGPMTVDGRAFAEKLDLKSTLFDPTITESGPAAGPDGRSAQDAPGVVSTSTPWHHVRHGTDPSIWLALLVLAAATVAGIAKLLCIGLPRREANAQQSQETDV
jgi:SpoIID/LytB domain protein